MSEERPGKSGKGSGRHIFIGWAVGMSNHELELDFFGSFKEIIDLLKSQGRRFPDVARHLETEITQSEIHADATEIPELKNAPPGLAPVVEAILGDDPDRLRRALLEHPSLFESPEGAGIPLAMASFLGRIDLAKLLLEGGAPPGQSFRLGMTPLHWAAAAGQRDIAQLLLEAGAEGEMNWFLLTPDHLAFRNGHLELAAWLEERIPDSWKQLDFGHIIGLLAGDGEISSSSDPASPPAEG